MKLKIDTALLSTSDKSNLEKFAIELRDMNVEMIATDGTASYLSKRGIETTSVEDITGFPEILRGRVKTLHPKIHGGILAKHSEADMKELKHLGIRKIDLVVVELYSFRDAVESSESHEKIVEKIDIGGLALARAGAKNYENTCTIVNQTNYDRILEEMKKNDGKISQKTRLKMAVEAFKRAEEYNKAIKEYLYRFSKKGY
ncbi:MAG: IMP cyclohydrolase [Candidatus Hadarchaeota archaeon]